MTKRKRDDGEDIKEDKMMGMMIKSRKMMMEIMRTIGRSEQKWGSEGKTDERGE